MPRFVIGTDRQIVENMLRTNEVTGNLNQDTPRTTLTRFKVLSEIRSQAKLYIDMLPREEKFQPLRACLETILKNTQKPIYECAESMIPYPIECAIKNTFFKPAYEVKCEALSQSEIEILKKTSPRGEAAVAAIDKLIKNEDSSCYDSSYSAIQKGVKDFRGDHPSSIQPKTNKKP